MNNIILNFNKFKQNEYFPFVFLAIIELILHILFFKPNFGDDIQAIHFLDNVNLWEYSISGYRTWASRIFINSLWAILARMPIVVWQFLDSCMFFLLAYSISILFVKEKKEFYNWIIVGFIFLYPFTHMSSAGWMATTMSYFWSIVLSVYSCTLLINDKPLYWYNYLVYSLAALYGYNAEQSAVVFTVILLGILGYCFIQKNKSILRRIVFLLVFSLSNLFLHLLCPGNSSRSISETITWNSDFLMRTTIEKLQLGFSEIFSHFLLAPNIIFLLLTGCILIIMCKKYNNVYCKIISQIPFGVIFFIGFCFSIISIVFPKVGILYPKREVCFGNQVYGGLVNIDNFRSYMSYIPLFVMFFCMLCIAYGIYFCIDNEKIAFLAILIYFCGIGSGMIMGFSPTLYASGARTYINTYICFIVVTIVLLIQNDKLFSEKNKTRFLNFLAVCSILNTINIIACA